jgi:hypothetical protein
MIVGDCVQDPENGSVGLVVDYLEDGDGLEWVDILWTSRPFQTDDQSSWHHPLQLRVVGKTKKVGQDVQ